MPRSCLAHLALICCAVGGAVACDSTVEPAGPVAFSLAGRFDTSLFTSTRGGPNGTLIHDTTLTLIADSIYADIEIDSLDSSPFGNMSIHQCGSCFGGTVAASRDFGGRRTGDSVLMTLMVGLNPRFNLYAVSRGDSIYGTIEFLYITSSTRRNVGTFVARRTP